MSFYCLGFPVFICFHEVMIGLYFAAILLMRADTLTPFLSPLLLLLLLFFTGCLGLADGSIYAQLG